jgi:hypothetical protein
MPIAATVQARPAPHREIRKFLRYQHRVSFPDSLATPRSTFKGRRLSSPKTIQNQSLTRTALNLWSAEVWRQTAEREKLRAPRGSPQCGGFAANARHYWRFERAKNGGRKLSEAGLAEGEELTSNGLLICNPRSCFRKANSYPTMPLKNCCFLPLHWIAV